MTRSLFHLRCILDGLSCKRSPLILLCRVGQIELLHQLGLTICVPNGVVAEIEIDPDDPASCMLRECSWLKQVKVSVPDGIKAWDLGCGESEVIAHALSTSGFRPLLDDAEGKACALAFGLKPIGTGGLLILAKRAGLLDSVGKALNDMRAEGLWISNTVFHTIVEMAGETEDLQRLPDVDK